jgi:hypothetical protein
MTASSQTLHIAPSLRLFVPNGLTEYNNPFLLDVSVVQSSRWWFSSCSRCSFVVQSSRWLFSICPRCSLLKTGRLERFLDEMWLFSCTNAFLFFFFFFFLSGWRSNVPVPTLSAVPSCVWVVAGPSKMRSY